MEYAPINLASPGARTASPFQTTLGPYDYWAIEYAYKPLPPGSKPEDERAELQRIAARSSEPLLAFGTDEDIFAGVELPLIPLLNALKKENGGAWAERQWKACEALLAEGLTLDELQAVTAAPLLPQ